jgi:hypothetical protein
MKKQNIIIIVLLVLVGAAVFTFTSGMFSIIDDTNPTGPTCVVENTGGNCKLMLKLDAGQKLGDGYSFDLQVKPIYDADFKGEQTLTLAAKSGPVYDWDYANNNPISEQVIVAYVYNLPDGMKNVYQYNITSRATASLSTSSLSTARAYAHIQAGYVGVPYTQSVVEICPYQDDDSCPADTHLLNQWTDAQGRKSFNYNHLYFIGSYNELQVRGGSTSYPRSTSGEVASTSIIAGSSIPSLNGKAAVRTASDVRDYMGSVTFTEPVATMSWKEQYEISDMSVMIGDKVVVTYPGIVNASKRIYLPSLTSAINEYCGRTGLFPRDTECIVPMTFTSSRGGEIVIVSELGELNQVGGDFNFNMFTGWITFDTEGEPVNAWITIGVIVVILGVIVFLIVRKKK